jgi:hypothetical protein
LAKPPQRITTVLRRSAKDERIDRMAEGRRHLIIPMTVTCGHTNPSFRTSYTGLRVTSAHATAGRGPSNIRQRALLARAVVFGSAVLALTARTGAAQQQPGTAPVIPGASRDPRSGYALRRVQSELLSILSLLSFLDLLRRFPAAWPSAAFRLSAPEFKAPPLRIAFR